MLFNRFAKYIFIILINSLFVKTYPKCIIHCVVFAFEIISPQVFVIMRQHAGALHTHGHLIMQ